MNRRIFITGAIIAASLVWVSTVAVAYRAIRRFETTPGQSAIAPERWPSSSRIRPRDGEWSLVMLVHPHCSCSRASVQELQAIIDKSPSVRPYVLVYRPNSFKPGWERTEVVAAASRLRRARVVIDENGREARLFGGFTSGQTILYDANGNLRFAGGITSLRGHAGINGGRMEVINIVSSREGSGSHPVFGCAIASRTERKP